MQNTLNKLLDVLFPPRESQLIIRSYHPSRTTGQPGCYEGIFYCAEYTEPTIRAAISENKFHNNTQAQVILAQVLSDWVTGKKLTNIQFVAIPLGKGRLRSRGHNQVSSILQHTNYSHQSDLLVRTKETVPQTALDRHQRLHNIKNIFYCSGEQAKNLSAQTIILLDDVVTTGATLNEARATLVPHLPPHTRLICLALAH